METSDVYFPHAIFAPGTSGERPRPRVFIAPARYVQGPGVLEGLGRYLSILHPERAALLMSKRGFQNEGLRLKASLGASEIAVVERVFEGECCLEQISAHADGLAEEKIDVLVAAGGGKCVDAGKAIAHRLGVPIVIVPTLASNDAPCSAVSVLYSPEGVSTGVEFYPRSPAFVVVDTELIAGAPERYLVAGMGDAMATHYEARVCRENPAASTTIGARPTLAASAIGEVCAQTLFERGLEAAAAVASGVVDEALEAVVEANTLLSGLGFESGGLAAAHGVAQSYTAIDVVNANYLHGEMVAMGTLAQLMLEARESEAGRVAEFFARAGLPVHLGQLSLDPDDRAALHTIVEGTLAFPFIGNMPMQVSADSIAAAVRGAHELGRSVADRIGDTAYRRLQAG